MIVKGAVQKIPYFKKMMVRGKKSKIVYPSIPLSRIIIIKICSKKVIKKKICILTLKNIVVFSPSTILLVTELHVLKSTEDATVHDGSGIFLTKCRRKNAAYCCVTVKTHA